MSIRYVKPATRRTATGRVAEVYAASVAEFGQPALAMLSPAPDVHAAAWALLREAELAGRAPRTAKEVLAVAVSRANACRFCLDAHTVLLHALGEHRLAEDLLAGREPADPWLARLAAWAATTGRVRTPPRQPPFPAGPTAEYVGTALSTHLVNRLFSALTDERLLPGNLQRAAPVRRVGGLALARTAQREPHPGGSLPLLSGIPAGPEPAWAAGTPVGAALAALRGATAAAPLDADGRSVLRDAVAAWDGRRPDGAWVDARLAGLDPAGRPAARLAVLAALSPHAVGAAQVGAWRAATGGGDADLVRLLAHGATAAVDRIEVAIAGRPAPSGVPGWRSRTGPGAGSP